MTLCSAAEMRRLHQYCGNAYLFECPTGFGNKAERGRSCDAACLFLKGRSSCAALQMSILQIADELSERLLKIFLKAEDGACQAQRNLRL